MQNIRKTDNLKLTIFTMKLHKATVSHLATPDCWMGEVVWTRHVRAADSRLCRRDAFAHPGSFLPAHIQRISSGYVQNTVLQS